MNVDVRVRRSLDRRDPYWILDVAQCPFCGKDHNHGGGSLDHPPALGFRLSHCLKQPRDYELIEEGIDLDGVTDADRRPA